MGFYKRKYLRNSSLRLLIPCAIVCCDPFIDFIGHYLKRDTHKYKEWGWKKNDMNLDIWPGSEYHYDERNKLFSFSKKATLKATTLSIRMCSTELLLSKNQKGSTRYPVILYKWDSKADIFLWIFNFFSDKLISQNSSKTLIAKSFYLLRMSDDYCFRRAAQRQLSECIRRNTATVLRVVVKSHNGLKGAKVLACGRARVRTFYCKVTTYNSL